jgi:hypothetical protein
MMPERQAGYTARTASATARAVSMALGCLAQVGFAVRPASRARVIVQLTVSEPPLGCDAHTVTQAGPRSMYWMVPPAF